MLDVKSFEEVKKDLEKMLAEERERGTFKNSVIVLDLDIDYLKQRYDAFGESQETYDLEKVEELIKSVPQIVYCSLFKHHDGSRYNIYDNHFVMACFAAEDAHQLASTIKSQIEKAKMPLCKPDLGKKEVNTEDGPIVFDPEKIRVHIGVAVYSGENPDFNSILNRAKNAEETSKKLSPKILVSRM